VVASRGDPGIEHKSRGLAFKFLCVTLIGLPISSSDSSKLRVGEPEFDRTFAVGDFDLDRRGCWLRSSLFALKLGAGGGTFVDCAEDDVLDIHGEIMGEASDGVYEGAIVVS
jgi:hypothetical protein